MQKANEANIALDELASLPPRSRRWWPWSRKASCLPSWPAGRRGCAGREGEPEQVMAGRGLAMVRDDSVTQAAVDEALAANPDVAEKIRAGKVAAAGAIVGAVMKATVGRQTQDGCASWCWPPAGTARRSANSSTDRSNGLSHDCGA